MIHSCFWHVSFPTHSAQFCQVVQCKKWYFTAVTVYVNVYVRLIYPVDVRLTEAYQNHGFLLRVGVRADKDQQSQLCWRSVVLASLSSHWRKNYLHVCWWGESAGLLSVLWSKEVSKETHTPSGSSRVSTKGRQEFEFEIELTPGCDLLGLWRLGVPLLFLGFPGLFRSFFVWNVVEVPTLLCSTKKQSGKFFDHTSFVTIVLTYICICWSGS